MKTSLKNRLLILLNFFAIIPKSLCYLKEGNFGAEERGRGRVQTKMVDKFIALQFPFSSKLKIWSFRVVVGQGSDCKETYK